MPKVTEQLLFDILDHHNIKPDPNMGMRVCPGTGYVSKKDRKDGVKNTKTFKKLLDL